MAGSSLDIVRELTGSEATPELVVALEAAPAPTIDALAQAIVDNVGRSVRVAPPLTEIWPVVSLRASTFGAGELFRTAGGPAGLNLNAALGPRFAGTGKFSNGILRSLLYCHGLVIEDPLAAAAEMYVGVPADQRPLARLALIAALTSCIEIAPLLDESIIDTYFTPLEQLDPARRLSKALGDRLSSTGTEFPIEELCDAFESQVVDAGLSPSLQELWRRIRHGDSSPPLSLVHQAAEEDPGTLEVFLDVVPTLNAQTVLEDAVGITAATLLAVEGLGGFYDLLCPSALFAKLLFLGAPDPTAELRLHELGRVDVPGLGRLLMRDAVRIRQSSDAFAAWREQLSDALDYAHNLRGENRRPDLINEAVRDHVADARARPHREARETRVLSGINPWTFITGALGGAIGGSPGGAIGSGAAATGGTVAALLQAIMKVRRVPAYLDRHYLVFEPEKY